MYILGIETSCDETSASILEVQDGHFKILSNVVSSQIDLHAPFGGVVPALAAREHVQNLPHVVTHALKEAKIETPDVIAVTSGPGLISSLLVGTSFAQTIAWKNNIPLIGVNHIEGHIYSNWLDEHQVAHILFPALCLIVSGGHTQLVLMHDHGQYELIGQTRDDAAGEAFDKIARILELGYPGGPAIAKTAETFTPHQSLGIEFPRPMIQSNDFDFSFSGLKTSVLYKVRDLSLSHTLENIRAEIAHEAQKAIVETLVTKTIRAAERYNVKSILLAGGVSANALLRQSLMHASDSQGIKCVIPAREYTTDNAAMIAMAGYWNYMRGDQMPIWSGIQANANWEIV